MVFEIIAIALLTVIASAVGVLSGFGLSTIMMPILTIFLPFGQVIFLVGIIHWFGDFWKVLFFKKGVDWTLFLYFGIPGIFTTYLGARLIGEGRPGMASLMGAFLIAYAIFMFLLPNVKLPKTLPVGIVGGAVSGFLAGVFGIRGAVRSVFLISFGLPKIKYIATMGAIGILVDTIRVTTYYWDGIRLEPSLMWGLLFFIPASWVGAYVARYFVHTISQKRFEAIVALFLLLVGMTLLFFS